MSFLFDLPAPLFSAIDGALAWLPAVCRLLLWSALGGALCMLIYKWTSPQRRLSEIGAELAQLRAELAADGELEQQLPLVRRNLSLALSKFLLSLGPALLAAYPGIALYLWMQSVFAGHEYLAIGPSFVRSWQAIALSVMLAVSLTLKLVLHIR